MEESQREVERGRRSIIECLEKLLLNACFFQIPRMVHHKVQSVRYICNLKSIICTATNCLQSIERRMSKMIFFVTNFYQSFIQHHFYCWGISSEREANPITQIMANEVKSEFSVQEEFTRLGWRNDADSGALNFATITWKMNLFLWLKLFLRTKFFCFNFNFKWAPYDVELVAKSKIQKTEKKKTCRVGVFSRSRRHVRTRSINVQILFTPFSLQFRWTMLIYRFRYCYF